QDSAHPAHDADDHYLDEMLPDDVAAARPERPAQTGDRCGAQEFREHEAERVEDADREKKPREPDLQTVLLADHVVHDEPRAHVHDPVVQRPAETAVALLIAHVVVDEALESLPLGYRRHLDPVLEPVAVLREQLVE